MKSRGKKIHNSAAAMERAHVLQCWAYKGNKMRTKPGESAPGLCVLCHDIQVRRQANYIGIE